MSRSLFTLAAGCALTAALAGAAAPAAAQSTLPGGVPLKLPAPNAVGGSGRQRPSVWSDLFGDTLTEVKQMPSRNTLAWLTIGTAATLLTLPADHKTTVEFSDKAGSTFKPGRLVGSTPLQIGASLLAYGIGRATDKPRVTAVAADLFQAQLLAEGMTVGIKQTVRRPRPEGSGFSFPSGHTTVSFASATVLQRHLGWKAGVPAYAVASYVAASRIEARRHNLSDVAFGAALGIIAGRTVSLGHTHGLAMSPLAGADGGGISFTLVRKNAN